MTAGNLSPELSVISIQSSSPNAKGNSAALHMLHGKDESFESSLSSSSTLPARKNCAAHISIVVTATDEISGMTAASYISSPSSFQSVSILRWDGEDRRQRKRGLRSAVRFPASPVTEVHERPITPFEDKASLYYSAEEIWNFRRDARIILRARAAARQLSASCAQKERDSSILSSMLPSSLVGAAQALAKSLLGAQLDEIYDDSSSSSVLIDSLYFF
eukprot:12970800-Ditylum_brightwellii.AAC.1